MEGSYRVIWRGGGQKGGGQLQGDMEGGWAEGWRAVTG